MMLQLVFGVLHLLAAFGESLVHRVALHAQVLHRVVEDVVDQGAEVDGGQLLSLRPIDVVMAVLRPSLWRGSTAYGTWKATY